MKYFSILFLIFLLGITPVFSSSTELQKILLDIQAAESKKNPQTALELAKVLEKKSLAEKNRGFYVRAVAKRVLNECHILGKAPKEKVRILREEIAKAPDEIRPLLKIILAKWFWHYYQQNIYKFSARTQTAGLDSNDFTTWDLPKIFVETRNLFEEGLMNVEYLKKTNTGDYEGVIERGNLFTGASISLYEFALREMLEFLVNGISSLPSPEDKFEIDVESGAFAHHKKFLEYHPQTTDNNSPLLRAIMLYQDLLSYYQKEKQLDRFVDADINRLLLMNSVATGVDKKEIFIKRLSEIEAEFKNIELVTLASYQIALQYSEEQNFVMAMNHCNNAISFYPNSDGARQCQNLKMDVTHSQFSIKMDNTINESNSILKLKYKNIKKIYFRIVRDDWKKYIGRKWRGVEDRLEIADIDFLLKEKPLQEWAVDLKETSDFKEKELEQKIPDLPYGFYRIFASTDASFSSRQQSANMEMNYSSFWQTDIMFLVKGELSSSRENGKIGGIVLDARTGEPLNRQKINIYKRNHKSDGIYEKFDDVTSNENGFWEFISNNRDWDFYFHLESSENGELLYSQRVDASYSNKKESASRVIFFTDRAIYRPGQRIFYKGICYKFDQEKDIYQTIKCDDLEIRLLDNNGKEVGKEIKDANDWGSFSGDFIAPQNVLTGKMKIVANEMRGETTISVEEYKRPKFEVTLMTPEKQFRLEENVEVHGKALSYAGAPLISAKVKYRVVRGVKLPWWWYWENPYSAEQEISHGIITTNDSGEFVVEFLAKPNKSVNKKFNPSFNYRVEVDVIDSTGETRSNNLSFNIGHTSMVAIPTLPKWLPEDDDIKMEISTTTLDNKPIIAQGIVDIHELIGPSKVMRRPTMDQYRNWYWYWAMDQGSKGGASEEDDSPKDFSNIENWKIGKAINSLPFKSEKGKGTLTFKLKEGSYCAILKTKDQFNNEIEEKLFFNVFPKLTKNSFSAKLPFFFEIKKTVLNPGDKLEAVWGTGYSKSRALVSFIQNGKVLKSYWTKGNEPFHHINFPITEKLKGGFTLQLVYVQENQLYFQSSFISVLRPEKEFKVSVETMRSKLYPGEKDRWSLKVEGYKAQKVAAELVATMYDASLDLFAPLNFPSFDGHWNDSEAIGYATALFQKELVSLYDVNRNYKQISRRYPTFSDDIVDQISYLFPVEYRNKSRFDLSSKSFAPNSLAESEGDKQNITDSMEDTSIASSLPLLSSSSSPIVSTLPSPEISIRKNLQESAFFYPHLITDDKGVVKLEFTIPEALTRWKFMAMAHGKNSEMGTVMAEVVTQKELMVTPNSPRFLRQGDFLYFTAKLDNTSEQEQKGEIVLELQNANNNKEVTSSLLMKERSFKFNIPA